MGVTILGSSTQFLLYKQISIGFKTLSHSKEIQTGEHFALHCRRSLVPSCELQTVSLQETMM